jgi:hypothetical protein
MVSQETEEKGLKLFKEGRVVKELETSKRTHFKVVGDTDVYFVIFDKEKNEFSCDCKFFSLHQEKCSHIIAAELALKA